MHKTFGKFLLNGKTALVTGGATGIGYHLARALASVGAQVIIAARREELLSEAAEALTEDTGTKVSWCQLDLSDRQQTAAIAGQLIKEHSGIDILVGNAGIDGFQPIEQIVDDDLDRVLMVNLTANITLAKHFLAYMRQNKWGRVIFCSSINERLVSAQEGMTAYAASKSALSSVARTIAFEAGRDGVTANSLVIGACLTDMLSGILDRLEPEQREGLTQSMLSQNALGRFASPAEFEGVVQLLASDAGSYITGSALTIDGGWTANLKSNPV